eukprot:4383867-Pyramimonas_sp.AAC.1
MPKSSTRYIRKTIHLVPSKTLESERRLRNRKSFLGSSLGRPCSSSETLPGTLQRVPAHVQARVEACQKPSRSSCRLKRTAPGIPDR